MRELRIGRVVLTFSLGAMGTMLAAAITAAQTTTTTPAPPRPALRGVEVKKPVAPAPAVRPAGTIELAPIAPPSPAPPMPAPPVVLMNDVMVPMNRAGQVAQLTEQFRPYLRVEYHFLRSVCALTPEQCTQIAREAEGAYREAVGQYCEMQRPGQFRRAGETPRVVPDPRTLIQQGLARVANPFLNLHQATRYHDEIAARAEAWKRTAIRSIVTKLDQDLILSPEQRANLTESLTSRWAQEWFPKEFLLLNADWNLSRIPGNEVVPWLNSEQKKIWELISEGQRIANVVPAFPSIAVDFPEDEELTRAREAEAKETKGQP